MTTPDESQSRATTNRRHPPKALHPGSAVSWQHPMEPRTYPYERTAPRDDTTAGEMVATHSNDVCKTLTTCSPVSHYTHCYGEVKR